MLSPADTTKRQQQIETLADKLLELAANARDGVVEYGQFDAILSALHNAGFFPDGELVSAVARALVRG